ncbi:MAG: hypothetical protein PHW76_08370 [Alphaproteobacteria bacterium]|nr:hypothetical protein [Alphaproteobacteria bacterium]
MAKGSKKGCIKKKPDGSIITDEAVHKIIDKATSEAKEARRKRFDKRFSSTAPAPKYKAIPQEDGTILLDMDCEADALAEACGTANILFGLSLVNDLSGAICHSRKPSELSVANAGVAALAGIAPKDEAEAMLAAQMVATHKAAMGMLGRAVRATELQTVQWKSGFAIKLLRTFTMQMETLQRCRGHGQQTVRVEHVTVNAGGQAIVGNVQSGGGGAQQKTEGQPHATAIEYQPAPTMSALRYADTAGETVPVPRDA